jgi:hypothetical protein
VLASAVDDFQSGARSITLANILEDSSTTNTKSGTARSTAVADAGAFKETRVCIPLMSLALGTLQDKYMPMGTDFGMRLRLTFQDPNIVLRGTKTGTGVIPTAKYLLEDITFEAEYLDSDPGTYNAIVNESGGVLKVSGTGISNFQSTLPVTVGATTNTVLIPARFSSVRNYLTMMRPSTSAAGAEYNSAGQRTRANVENWVYRIHGRNYPNLPVVADDVNSSESMCEVLKCFHALHDTQSNCVFNASDYVENGYSAGTASTASVVANAPGGSFLLGTDFEEPMFHASQLSGMDTNSSNTFLELHHTDGYPALALDTFAFYDSIIEMNTTTGEVMVSK